MIPAELLGVFASKDLDDEDAGFAGCKTIMMIMKLTKWSCRFISSLDSLKQQLLFPPQNMI